MSGSERPYLRQQATKVFTNKQAIVIGPTPPGTGVIAPATSEQLENSASPTSRLLPLLPSTLLIPTSISVAPGLIQLPLTISALPTAATTISARPTTCSKFLVLECVMVIKIHEILLASANNLVVCTGPWKIDLWQVGQR